MSEYSIIVISCFLLWNLLAALEGYVRAHYEDYLYFADRKHRNLHGFYFVIRGIVLLPFSFVVYQQSSLVMDSQLMWITMAALFYMAGIMSYSFFYLGVLYTQRNILGPEVYKKRFFASKERGEDKNSAKLEIEFWPRAGYFCISICFITGIIFEANGGILQFFIPL